MHEHLRAHQPLQTLFVSFLSTALYFPAIFDYVCLRITAGPQMEAAPASGFSFIHNLESNIYANCGLVLALFCCQYHRLAEEEFSACAVFVSRA